MEQHTKDNETREEQKHRSLKVLRILVKTYPNAKCHLNYSTPFELLIGSILSAQCTDERVNRVTPGLFSKYPTPNDFASADQAELENDIFSCGFYRNKARSIIGCSKELVNKFHAEVPRTMLELTGLRGVGRKTANVVLGNAYGVPGIIVDTHIGRLSNRLGLSESKDPVKIEKDLNELIPHKSWTFFSNSLGDHGRNVCKARKPNCYDCTLRGLCPSAH